VTISRRRVGAVLHKELRDLRRSGNVVYAMVVLPLVFLIQPVIQLFAIPSSGSATLHHEHTLIYLLAVPALVPAPLASYSIVGERVQGTLEPLLSTPVREQELIFGKALAVFLPSVAVSYAVLASSSPSWRCSPPRGWHLPWSRFPTWWCRSSSPHSS